MTNDRIDITIINISAVLAILAMAATVANIGQPIQLFAAMGGILLGPGALAYRLATGSEWNECVMVGVAINVAILMMLAFAAVAVNFWHPKIELLIPFATCVLAITLHRRRKRGDHRGNNTQRSLR